MTIVLEPLGLRQQQQWVGIHWRLRRGHACLFELEHALRPHQQHRLPDASNADHVLVSTLLFAMQEGCPLEIHGHVSRRLLDGCELLQDIWSRWRPQRYQRIPMICAEECDRSSQGSQNSCPKSSALFAFSGGVDATFSLLRHYHGSAGRQTLTPRAALLVQGFDIPYGADLDFVAASTRARCILTECSEVGLLECRTNSRSLGVFWEDSFGLQLAGCFLALQNHFTHAIKASEAPYDTLSFPWGATPLTTPLTSTERISVIEDGCGFDRLEKVRYLATSTRSTPYLRVCWAGQQASANCGVCEKCVRTMLNFWVNGFAVPSAFPYPLTPRLVTAIVLRNVHQASALSDIRQRAVAQGLGASPLVSAVDRVLWRYRVSLLLRRCVALGHPLVSGMSRVWRAGIQPVQG